MNIIYQEVLLEEEINDVVNFLKRQNLKYERDIDYTIICKDGDSIVGTASLANNILKCIAVDENYQGQDISSKLVSLLINKLHSKNIFHYFLYSKVENIEIFKKLSLNLVSKTNNLAFFEGGITKINKELILIKNIYNINDKPKACIVLNCNPMTKGHLYLIEKCALENKEVLVFIVEEDLSLFPYNDRFDIVDKATSHLDNVTVLPSTEYIISKVTFPTYFLKETDDVINLHTELDIQVFKDHFMPIFNINKRYVGSEPYCETTNFYNESMKKILKDKFILVERKNYKNNPISASTVRKLIKEGNINQVKDLVVDATWEFLNSEKGRIICKKIKESNSRH